jgi:hypothetical protein
MQLGKNLAHVVLYSVGLRAPTSFTTAGEQAALKRYASGQKVIVELGVYEGASSLLLRQNMAPDGTLYCVDPFPAGRMGFSPQLLIARQQWNRCRNGKVVFLRQFSYEAVQGWSQPIDVLFHDAEISYESVRRDFLDWSKHVKPGGHLVMHPCRPGEKDLGEMNPGKSRFVGELMQIDPSFEVVAQVDSMTVLRRRPTPQDG